MKLKSNNFSTYLSQNEEPEKSRALREEYNSPALLINFTTALQLHELHSIRQRIINNLATTLCCNMPCDVDICLHFCAEFPQWRSDMESVL